MIAPDDILRFWFADGPATKRAVWFQSTPAFDLACRDLCGAHLDAARDGAFDAWAETAPGALALLILLDQMPRNIHRGTASAFACDAKARAMARAALARGHDREVHPVQRMFFYLPFEHAEDLAEQDISMRLFTALAAEPEFPNGARTLDFAARHRDVIRRFGRFPHRNAALGRVSTVAEADYLARPGAGF
jgi:uncharacterized protein (DUF924 family)